MARLEIWREGTKEGEVPVEGELVVGRDEAAQVRLDDKLVSRRHARIYPEEGAFVLEDLGTPNGTFVNGIREYKRKLKAGDRLEFGPFVLRFSEGEAFPPASDEPLPVEHAGATEAVGPGVLARLRQRMAAQLEPHLLLEGEDPPKVFPLKFGKTVIGGADTCHVRVPEAGKGEEATVERRPDGTFVARRLGLLGSLLVNGSKHKEKTLASGDTLVVGKASFKFREGAK